MTINQPRRVLIIGASRGIGFELVRQYLSEGWEVRATTRTPDHPGRLGKLSGDLTIHPLDVRDSEQLTLLARSVGHVDVAIHNAGVGLRIPRAEMMAVNADAPISAVEALLDAGAMAPGGKAVLVTSQMGARRGREGSLGDYGDSKAALNDEFRQRAPDWAARGLIAIVLHPGWVRTDMGGSSATLSVEASVAGIRELVAGLTESHHGRFWTWDGREHPW
ncbi:MAG: SDR family NAD(P)-dependent oxidoreductase [Acidimicrobiia bacterium]|nr:SDR family NAD(P)-dependent oxidoreductase [Acidimicrobiia bacterium]